MDLVIRGGESILHFCKLFGIYWSVTIRRRKRARM